MMDHKRNRKILQKQIIISNIINSVYLLLLCGIAFIDRIGISCCHTSVKALMEGVQNAEPDYIGGYAVIGGLLGAGTVAFLAAILYLVLIVCLVYILIFLLENVSGYLVYAKIKTEVYSNKLVKGVRRNAIIKCVLALLVIVPMACLFFSEQWFAALAVIIPQVVVLLLSVNTIRMLWGQRAQIEPEMPKGE